MKIGILGNCQHETLAIALRAVLPVADIVSFELLPAQRDEKLRDTIAAALARCDHVITAEVPPAFGPLATQALRARLRRVHILPAFAFAGFHPDSVGITVDHVQVNGPTNGIHSRLAIIGFLAGYSTRETADLYNRLVYTRLGYFNVFAEQRALLLESFAAYGIDLKAPFEAWLAPGCFMYSVNHPRMRVVLDLAREACRMMGVPPAKAPIGDGDLPEPLAALGTHPVLPDIAAFLDIPPSGAFRGSAVNGVRPRAMSTEVFITGSFAVFQRTPRSVLRRVEGVETALQALALTEKRPARKPRPKPPQEAAAFLAWQGTVLALDAESGMLVQCPLLAEDDDRDDLLTLLPALPITASAATQLMGGARVAPALLPGTVSLQRGEKYLCAAPGAVGVRFSSDSAGPWEMFLPVRVETLADLRRIASAHWITDSGMRLPAAMIRLLENFILAIGDFRVNLCVHPPRRLVRDDGSDGFEVISGGNVVTLFPNPVPPRTPFVLLEALPDRLQPPELATAEAFRAARHAQLRLPATQELMHPPLTACDGDRDFLLTRYFSRNDRPGVGPHFLQNAIIRAPDQLLMLDRSLEGVLLSKAGVAKDFGFLDKPSHKPSYLLALGDCRLLDMSAAADAPEIDGPACVFYNPNLQNFYHWSVESLLALHVMAPYLPPGTRLVVPETLSRFRQSGDTGFDHLSFLATLGFGKLPTLEMPGPFARLKDAIWLRDDSVFGLPAILMQSFRARGQAMCPPTEGKRRRIYIKRATSRRVLNTEAVEDVLKPHGFETVLLENMPAAAQISMFAGAEFVVGPHGAALANIAFCPPGTRLLELTPDEDFRPYFWLFAEKLGLRYGVLPCPCAATGFNGDFNVDIVRFRALFRMLRALTD